MDLIYQKRFHDFIFIFYFRKFEYDLSSCDFLFIYLAYLFCVLFSLILENYYPLSFQMCLLLQFSLLSFSAQL